MMEIIKHSVGRSYGQYCGLARALDVVGDRWNLLIVRELLPGPLRYSELKASLAGIATNLLAERLRTLEEHGIVERRLGDAGVRYALTEWGADLREPMEALGRWGAPLLATGRGGDSFRPRWLALALPAMLQGRTAAPPLEVGFEVEGVLIVLRIDGGGPSAGVDTDPRPRTVLAAAPETVVGLVAGALSVDQALASGDLHGDADVLRRAFPEGRPAATPPALLATEAACRPNLVAARRIRQKASPILERPLAEAPAGFAAGDDLRFAAEAFAGRMLGPPACLGHEVEGGQGRDDEGREQRDDGQSTGAALRP
jgi:DNA-binding HxlR family transcriptional regulator